LGYRAKREGNYGSGRRGRSPTQIHASRSLRARSMDESLKASLAKSPKQWVATPNRLDLEGIDTPKQRAKSASTSYLAKGRVKGQHGSYKPVYAVYTKVGNNWVLSWKDGKYGTFFDSEKDAKENIRKSAEAWQKAGVKEAGTEETKIVRIGTPEQLHDAYQKHKEYLKHLVTALFLF